MQHESDRSGYRNILVAYDFSPPAEAAVKQAAWLARKAGSRLTLAHVLPDLHRVVHSALALGDTDLLYGEGSVSQAEAQRESERLMKKLVDDLNATDLDITVKSLLGTPFSEIIGAVQQDGYDLVMAGTRGLAAWEQFIVGSTAKRLIRKCPSSVWIVKPEHAGPPRAVLAATDFSEVSHHAALEGLWIARQASAEFHLLHSIDYLIDYLADIPRTVDVRFPARGPLRSEINAGAQKRLEEFVASLGTDTARVQMHLSWGTPWQEIGRLANHLNVDLIAMGTVGRSGLKGVLMGNTAESVLSTCDCSMLTVKPADFVSPL